MHILGASGHAKVILDILLLSGGQPEGIWDDDPELQAFCGMPVLGTVDAFAALQTGPAIIAVGNNKIRKRIAQKLNCAMGLAIHPQSALAPSVHPGEGTVVMANASINADAKIGRHVIVNTNASIDHDCSISDFVHVSPQAGLAGNVQVGMGAHIGIGAVIIQGIKIGAWAVVGAGAVIINDVPDYAVVVGNPGRIIKFNTNENNER